MEPPSPIQALEVNPFSSRLIEERANENREMTVVSSYVKQQPANAFIRFKCITKDNGSIYKSTRVMVNSRN